MEVENTPAEDPEIFIRTFRKIHGRKKAIPTPKTAEQKAEESDARYWDLISRLAAKIEEVEGFDDLYSTLRFSYQGYSHRTKQHGPGQIYSRVLVAKTLVSELFKSYQTSLDRKFLTYHKTLWEPCLQMSTEDQWFDFLAQKTRNLNQLRAFKVYWGIYEQLIKKESQKSSQRVPEKGRENILLLVESFTPDKIRTEPLSEVLNPPLFSATNYIDKTALINRVMGECAHRRVKPKTNCSFRDSIAVFQVIFFMCGSLTKVFISDVEAFVKTMILHSDAGHDSAIHPFKMEVEEASKFILLVRVLFETTSFFETTRRAELKQWLIFLLRDHNYHYKTFEGYFDGSRIHKRNIINDCRRLERELVNKLPASVRSLSKDERSKRRKDRTKEKPNDSVRVKSNERQVSAVSAR
ncbi:MAG: hypothetical protein ACOYXT_08375 [Bacteroidota bacterium]